MAKIPRSEAPLDIKALLSVALEQQPRDDVSERVMSRVALMDTLMEFARLVVAAPVQGLLAHQGHGGTHHEDEHDHDDEHEHEPGDPPR